MVSEGGAFGGDEVMRVGHAKGTPENPQPFPYVRAQREDTVCEPGSSHQTRDLLRNCEE